MTGFPSLPLAQGDHDDQQQKFKGVSRIRGPLWAHLPTITIGLLGVQILWSVEMSYASPYLLSLGLSKSKMAVVFAAGPISGLIVQPLIGVLADSCTSRLGRRRPYMLSGIVICISSMLLLGFTRPVASIFTGWRTESNDILTIWLAVLSIYLIDFSINAVQAVDRALLVDTLPPSKQAACNAWAARMLGVGSVVGFFLGNIDLQSLLPFLGKSQLQVLSVVVSLLLLGVHLLMAGMVEERVLLKSSSADGKSNQKSFVREMKEIWSNIRTLPYVIRQICIIQFFAWIAWFPILFYSTVYIGDLHKRASPIPATNDEQASLDAEAERLGSRALFYSALLSLFVNLTLPLFVSEAATVTRTGSAKYSQKWWERHCRIPRRMQMHLASIWAFSLFVFSSCMFATFFTQSVRGTTLIITVTGFSWAVSVWAPYSLLSEAILTQPSGNAGSIRLADARIRRTSGENERDVFLPGHDSEDEDEVLREERRRALSNSGAQLSRISHHGVGADEDDFEMVQRPGVRDSDEGRGNSGALSAKAGVILGIHNIFIVIPQFLVTGFAAILFALLDPQKPGSPVLRAPTAPVPGAAINGTLLLVKNATMLVDSFSRADIVVTNSPHSNSVVYIFRVGGVAAACAGVICWRLAREMRHR